MGRGTKFQFQVIGHPDFALGSYVFTPMPRAGAMHPKHQGRKVYGTSLSGIRTEDIMKWKRLNLSYLIGYYEYLSTKTEFFNENLFFDKLAGTDQLRKQIIEGLSEEEIRDSWQDELTLFKKKRSNYLLYRDIQDTDGDY